MVVLPECQQNFLTLASIYSASIMAQKTIRVFEGFAGYGGASFGLKRSGLKYKVVGMSEFDSFASQLLSQNFPGIKNWGDITKIDPTELPDFDLFTDASGTDTRAASTTLSPRPTLSSGRPRWPGIRNVIRRSGDSWRRRAGM